MERSAARACVDGWMYLILVAPPMRFAALMTSAFWNPPQLGLDPLWHTFLSNAPLSRPLHYKSALVW